MKIQIMVEEIQSTGTDKMKRVLSSLSGITWLINDILWYWGYNMIAFVVCCFTVLFMAAYFINIKISENPSNFYIILILNIWVWMSMCSLIKDAFKPGALTITVINVIAFLLTAMSIGIVIRLLWDKDVVLARLRKI